MNRLFLILMIFSISLASKLYGKSFASLGEQNDEYSSVNSSETLEFPNDHGSHPTFRTECWYLTANLKNENGEPFGIQWTLFRSKLANRDSPNKWGNSQIWMGHAAVTTQNSHLFLEKFARGGVEQAGGKVPPFKAWIDDWYFSGDWDASQLSVAGDQFSYKLSLSAKKPLILHGYDGVSIKSHSGTKSFYYSQPFFEVDGLVTINGVNHNVTGQGWADREWSSQLLDENQIGWNWLGLHFDDGSKLMLFEVKSKSEIPFLSGTRVYKNGTYELLQSQDFTLSPKNSKQKKGDLINLEWQIKIPDENLLITVKPLNPNSYMKTLIPYWEGPVSFSGTHSGVGFLEVTLTD